MPEKPTTEKVCPQCQTPNQPNSETCFCCDYYIADVPETPVGGTSAEEQRPDGGGVATDEDAGGTTCPDCGAPVGAEGDCTRCGWSSGCGYTLIWQDDRLASLEIGSVRPVFIGRVPPADDALARKLEEFYPAVSRAHAEFFTDRQGNVYLRDLGSCNGTKVNNRRIVEFVHEPLQPGDEILFAGTIQAKLKKA